MARTRFTEEERIVNFFENANLAAATAVFNVVKGVFKKRLSTLDTAPFKPKTRRTRKAKAAAAAPTTSE